MHSVDYGADVLIGNLADGVVIGVGDIEIAGRIDRDRDGIVQLRAGCGSAVAGGTGAETRAARKGRNGSGRGYLADNIVAGVSDVQISRPVQRDTYGVIQLGAAGCFTIPAIAGGAGSGDGGDGSIGGFAHAMVCAIGDVNASRRVDGNAAGLVELRRSRRAVVAGKARGVVSRNGADDVLLAEQARGESDRRREKPKFHEIRRPSKVK